MNPKNKIEWTDALAEYLKKYVEGDMAPLWIRELPYCKVANKKCHPTRESAEKHIAGLGVDVMSLMDANIVVLSTLDTTDQRVK